MVGTRKLFVSGLSTANISRSTKSTQTHTLVYLYLYLITRDNHSILKQNTQKHKKEYNEHDCGIDIEYCCLRTRNETIDDCRKIGRWWIHSGFIETGCRSDQHIIYLRRNVFGIIPAYTKSFSKL